MFHSRNLIKSSCGSSAHKNDFRVTFLSIGLFIFATLVFVGSAQSRGAPESFADLVEEISPAVVNITTSTNVAQNTMPRGIVPEGSPFEDLFRDFNDRAKDKVQDLVRPLRSALALQFLRMVLSSLTIT